jgi:hypothetical protein
MKHIMNCQGQALDQDPKLLRCSVVEPFPLCLHHLWFAQATENGFQISLFWQSNTFAPVQSVGREQKELPTDQFEAWSSRVRAMIAKKCCTWCNTRLCNAPRNCKSSRTLATLASKSSKWPWAIGISSNGLGAISWFVFWFSLVFHYWHMWK